MCRNPTSCPWVCTEVGDSSQPSLPFSVVALGLTEPVLPALATCSCSFKHLIHSCSVHFCIPGQAECTPEYLVLSPRWHRSAPQGHFLKNKIACNDNYNYGTTLTVRFGREEMGEPAPKPALPRTSGVALAKCLPLRASASCLYKEGGHQGHFLLQCPRPLFLAYQPQCSPPLGQEAQ